MVLKPEPSQVRLRDKAFLIELIMYNKKSASYLSMCDAAQVSIKVEIADESLASALIYAYGAPMHPSCASWLYILVVHPGCVS
jgi:hypothetical protein